MTATLSGLATELQTLFTTTAAKAAQASRFVIRKRILDGPSFVQGVVLGWLANPHATVEELNLSVADAGATLSPQGLEQRFTSTAAECLRQVLAEAVKRVIGTNSSAITLLQRFQGVYLLDSTTIPLPAALTHLWRGCGGNTARAGQAALKVQVRWEVRSGALEGVSWSDGRAADAAAELASASLPAGALRIADLGYFDLGVLAQYSKGNVFWLTRIAPGTRVVANGRSWKLSDYLQQIGTDRVDQLVQLGAQEQLSCRLVAVRVSKSVAAHRRKRAGRKAGKSGRRLSAERSALCEWTVVATNLPITQATIDEVLILLRVRWQLELLFKSWKSSGVGLTESSSEKAWRVRCEVYAKLLGAVVRQWVVAVSGIGGPCVSVIRSGRAAQRYVCKLAGSFSCLTRMVETLTRVKQVLGGLKPVNKRKTRPATHQTLALTTTSD